MSIKIFFSGWLSRYLPEGNDFFEVNGRTGGDCLNRLVSRIPELRDILFFGERNTLRSTIKVMINKKSINPEGLVIKVKDGDEIYIKKNIR